MNTVLNMFKHNLSSLEEEVQNGMCMESVGVNEAKAVDEVRHDLEPKGNYDQIILMCFSDLVVVLGSYELGHAYTTG